ncbi:MAG TPA: hypothetical protein DCF99_15005 [Flavobacteriaceae bacterium]|nr:hypothetical protein [Flavobacteriaceae bacterium]
MRFINSFKPSIFILILLIGCISNGQMLNNNSVQKQLFEEVIRYDNGKIKSIIGLNENDQKEGITYEYFPNGLLLKETSYVNDKKEGLEISYFTNGYIESRGIYINGLAEGEFNYFYKNGKPFATLFFYNDLVISAKNCFTSKGEIVYCGPLTNGNGVFLKYDKKGNLISKDYFKNGKIIRTENIEVIK